MNQEIIEEIKETDFLKRAFFFESDDEKDFNYVFADDNQKLQFKYKQDLDDLKKYVEWCIFNNYPLKEQYLNYFSDI